MHILSTLNTSVFQTDSHWGTRSCSDFCTLAFCLSPDSCSWLTWIELKPWLSFMLEEFCSFDPERGRRSSARRQDALPLTSVQGIKEAVLHCAGGVHVSMWKLRSEIGHGFGGLVGEQREDTDVDWSSAFWGTVLQVPLSALNLKLLSDRWLVNNWLLSSLLNAAFLGLRKLIGKRCKGKKQDCFGSNSGIVFNPLKVNVCSHLKIVVRKKEEWMEGGPLSQRVGGWVELSLLRFLFPQQARRFFFLSLFFSRSY